MSEGVRRLERRYLISGELVLRTALHIGGGEQALGATQSPVLRRADGQPYIPGSSLKGAFRSTVEKLAATIGLPNSDVDVLDTGGAWLRSFHKCREDEGWNEEQTLRAVRESWPATALLFGTLYSASKVAFSDAYLLGDQSGLIQARDGVAIDRDSERAKDGLLYSYEVVAPTLRFDFELALENPSDLELGLVALGLAELRGGFFSLGGKRSSGLGRCQLDPIAIYALDLRDDDRAARGRRLSRYLSGATLAERYDAEPNPDAFITRQIEQLLEVA